MVDTKEESSLELIMGVLIVFTPFWLCFTYSGQAVIKSLIKLILQ